MFFRVLKLYFVFIMEVLLVLGISIPYNSDKATTYIWYLWTRLFHPKTSHTRSTLKAHLICFPAKRERERDRPLSVSHLGWLAPKQNHFQFTMFNLTYLASEAIVKDQLRLFREKIGRSFDCHWAELCRLPGCLMTSQKPSAHIVLFEVKS